MLKKGALSLLSQYEGDSSDDDVPGPRVSTKRTFKDDENNTNNYKKRLPVPEVLRAMDSSPEGYESNPSEHGGRIRSFPHERGNWATYLYIPLDHSEGVIDLVGEIITICPNINMQAVDDFHVSLTKTVILKYHWITPFIESIKLSTNYFKKFVIMFDDLKIYCNEERTRTFIGLRIKTGYDSLVKLVDICNSCLAEFKLPLFYDEASFHMSIAWCVGDHEEELNHLLPQLNSKLNELVDNYSQVYWYIHVNLLICKSGNKLFKFDLT